MYTKIGTWKDANHDVIDMQIKTQIKYHHTLAGMAWKKPLITCAEKDAEQLEFS